MKSTPVLIGDLCADHVGRQVVADKYRGVIARVTHWRDDGCPVTEIEIEQNYDKGIQPVRFHSPSYAVVITEDMSVRTKWTLRDVGELADEFERHYKVRMSSDTFACGVMHAVRAFRALAAASEEETS